MSYLRLISLLAILVIHTACPGGGGGGSAKRPNTPEENGDPFCELSATRLANGSFQLNLRAGNFSSLMGVASVSDNFLNNAFIGLGRVENQLSRGRGPLFMGSCIFPAPPPNKSTPVVASIPTAQGPVSCQTVLNG